MPISPVDEQNPRGDGQHAAEGSAQEGADSAVDGGHGRGDVIDAQEPEEIQPRKDLKAPDMPSKAEVAQHRANGHLPYRNWCPDCVEAFGREWPHSAHAMGRLIPLISCDYLFVTQKGVFSKSELSEDEREDALKVLVAYCSATGSMFAHAVPSKGVDEEGYIVEQLKQDVLWLGHSKVIVRSDNEPALLQVVATTLTALKVAGVASSDEGSVPYDPQTNGAAENAVKLFKGTLKAMMLGLERQLEARVPIDHPIVTWMAVYAAQVRTMTVRGSDGKTAHQRARGTPSSTRLLSF